MRMMGEQPAMAVIETALRTGGYLDANAVVHFEPLTGGVASDIWRLRGAHEDVVVKMALERLRVEADWRVAVSRNAAEVAWLKQVKNILPDNVPDVIYHDREHGFFVMNYYPADRYPVWKGELLAGRIDPSFARSVGTALAKIHSSTSGKVDLAEKVNSDELFRDIRIAPYLFWLVQFDTSLAEPVSALNAQLLANKKVLVHSDISPKNILVGPQGPVFLDAEGAWYGDPAFDLAFCLNHLLLKSLFLPGCAKKLAESFEELCSGYLAAVDWEEPREVERRACRLLPALMLARVDGKSPVEYLRSPELKSSIREFSAPQMLSANDDLSLLLDAWAQALGKSGNSE
jgi:fructosamine-3-kinase